MSRYTNRVEQADYLKLFGAAPMLTPKERTQNMINTYTQAFILQLRDKVSKKLNEMSIYYIKNIKKNAREALNKAMSDGAVGDGVNVIGYFTKRRHSNLKYVAEMCAISDFMGEYTKNVEKVSTVVMPSGSISIRFTYKDTKDAEDDIARLKARGMDFSMNQGGERYTDIADVTVAKGAGELGMAITHIMARSSFLMEALAFESANSRMETLAIMPAMMEIAKNLTEIRKYAEGITEGSGSQTTISIRNSKEIINIVDQTLPHITGFLTGFNDSIGFNIVEALKSDEEGETDAVSRISQ